MAKERLVSGLDIGTTKVCCVIANLTEEGEIEVIGVGTSPSYGLRRGVVVNIESTTKSIERAVEEAELMSGMKIDSVYAGIAGSHIQGMNSHGVIAITGGEVSKQDVERVVEAARAITIPLDREVILVLPQQFIVDGQDGIKDPVGMKGVRLEVEIHIVTALATSTQNLVSCIEKAGLGVNEIVLGPLAGSYAVLDEDEKTLGVALIDIGGGTSDVVIFIEGSIWHTEVFSIGGEHVTKDISVGLRTPLAEAEKIKIKHGCAMGSLVKADEQIEVPGIGGRATKTLSRKVLAEIIEPRMEEIFTLVNKQIKRSGYENLVAAGVVLTGGGAMLDGSGELAERIFGLPVRIGYPKGIGGLKDIVNSPLYATSVGLVVYGAKKILNEKKGGIGRGSPFDGIIRGAQKIYEWFSKFF